MSFNNTEVYSAIENINMDYIKLKESKKYSAGNLVVEALDYLKRFSFFSLIKKIFVRCYIRNHLFMPADKSSPIEIHAAVSGKVVIYACIAGPYDTQKEPLLPEKNVDYIIYTDQPKLNNNTIWQYRDIPKKVCDLSSNGKIRNVYIRTHPHEFFPEYDYSIYIDGSMQIISDVTSWIDLISPKAGIAMHKHNCCNSVYKEGKSFILRGFGNAEGIRKQLKHYQTENVPDEIGLVETGAIVTDLKSLDARQIYDNWWSDFYRWNGQRDQLSIGYVLWKMGIPIEDIATLGSNVWRNPKLRHHAHEMSCYHELQEDFQTDRY